MARCIEPSQTRPKTQKSPAAVILPQGFGGIFNCSAEIADLAKKGCPFFDHFAAAGYVAIAPAFFDHIENDVELDYDAKGIARGRALIGELDIDQVMADVGSAAGSIRFAGKIGVVGYCWGGTIAMLASSRLGLPGVSYYGARNVAWLHENFSAPLQFHFGANDTSIPPEAIERHRECLPDAEIYIYPAAHGFNCDRRKDFDAASAALAGQRTLAFFAQHLGPST